MPTFLYSCTQDPKAQAAFSAAGGLTVDQHHADGPGDYALPLRARPAGGRLLAGLRAGDLLVASPLDLGEKSLVSHLLQQSSLSVEPSPAGSSTDEPSIVELSQTDLRPDEPSVTMPSPAAPAASAPAVTSPIVAIAPPKTPPAGQAPAKASGSRRE